MTKEEKQKLIESFKKSNKERRLKIAQKAGFTTPEAYLTSLTGKKVKSLKKFTGTFYVIDILDATGSMQGGKYNNSKEGIIGGIKDMSKRNESISYSLVEFIQLNASLNRAIVKQDPKNVNTINIKFSGAIGADTPLYKTVYDIIEEFRKFVKNEDKVLINVYTDGGNNSAYQYQSMAANLINEVQKKNFTITFVATPQDLEKIKKDINIDESNTLATSNTAEGFKMSMNQTRAAKAAYFTAASAGEDVLIGFYKKSGQL